MKLLDHLTKTHGDQLAISSSLGRINYNEIVAESRNYSGFFSGKKVAFHSSNIIDAVVFMVAVDGFGASLVLLQPEEDIGATVDLIDASGVDLVISDRFIELEKLVYIPVFQNINDALKRCVHEKKVSDKKSNTSWIISTSGTTGKPKLVEHSLYSLTKTSTNNKEKGRNQVWGLLYGFTRFAGLQVVLQSLLNGSTLVAPDVHCSLGEKLSMLSKYNCTHLSATPTMWRQISMNPLSKNLSLKQITLGGEISDDKILGGLNKSYPSAYVTHIYASTEAGVGFSVKDGKSGFPAIYLSNPPNGIDIKVVGGRLWIRNDHVGDKYLGNDKNVSEDGWVDTGDNVSVNKDRVHFLGRDNGVINVGGNKVHPETVESALLSHPMVDDAKVYAKKNPIMGALVVADIIVRDQGIENKEVIREIKEFLSNKLESFMVPAIVKIVNEFDVNSAGKVTRKQ